MRETLLASRTGVEVTCGQEKGVFELALFGPGGGSRCIRFGEHLVTPIEFEALAGKRSRNWKSNIKVGGKSLKNYFASDLLKSCAKGCPCSNCETGRNHPTDLELLIEKVYINTTVDLSIVKTEKEEKNVTEKMVELPDEDSTIVSDVKDEFFSSPETTPKKKKKRSSVETPMDEILPVDDSPATSEQSGQRKKELNSPIHVITTHNFDMTGKPITQIVNIPEEKMIRDELVPVKHQQDIRSFFSTSEGSEEAGGVGSPPRSPAGRSDSSVEVTDVKSRIKVQEVDLTDGKEERPRRGPSRQVGVVKVEENMLEILHQEKKKALTPRKKLPRDAKNSSNKEVSKPGAENQAKRKRVDLSETNKKISPASAPVRKSARNEASNEVKRTEEVRPGERPKRDGAQSGLTQTPVKTEKVEAEKVSPSKLPTYTTMIKSALEEMNCDGGEGCTKLEILLYILRKFRPKGNVEQITSKLIKVLEVGTKRGDFLSSVSCPRVIKKDSQEVSEASEKGEKEKKKKISVTKTKTKVGKEVVVKRGRPASVNSNKDKKEKKKEKVKAKEQPKVKTKEKKVINYTSKKLLEPLSTICKVKKGTRYEVLRKVWTYIRLKKLQDPTDRTTILCDENLKKLTKCKKFNQNALMGYLKPFMKPL